MNAMYDKVTLIGLGLIASSMGHAMKKSWISKYNSGIFSD